jgi:DUF1680 family protein
MRQETHFPDSPETRLVIETAGTLTLNLRIPSWVSAPVTVKINGKTSDAVSSPGSYLRIARDWRKGDVIDMSLPMALRFEAMPDDEHLRAILYGPLVLAGGLGREPAMKTIGPLGPEMKKAPAVPIPQFSAANKPPSEWLRQTGPLTFETLAPSSPVSFAPLHRTHDQRYSIYWRMSQTSES